MVGSWSRLVFYSDLRFEPFECCDPFDAHFHRFEAINGVRPHEILHSQVVLRSMPLRSRTPINETRRILLLLAPTRAQRASRAIFEVARASCERMGPYSQMDQPIQGVASCKSGHMTRPLQIVRQARHLHINHVRRSRIRRPHTSTGLFQRRSFKPSFECIIP